MAWENAGRDERKVNDGQTCVALASSLHGCLGSALDVFMVPIEHTDTVNARILSVSEDKIAGFVRAPFAEIARETELPLETVLERIRDMLEAGTIRRVRQTLLATNLASGALVAWKVPTEKLDAAFDFMFQEDPYSGHVVIRSTDAKIPGEAYKLWTTLKVPAGFSLDAHCKSAVPPDRRGSLPPHAGKGNLCPWSRPCAAQDDQTRRQGI